MKIRNHRVISDFLFSNQKRKSELWNSTRTHQTQDGRSIACPIQPHFNHITGIKPLGFSTLYTTIPHDKLKNRLASIIWNSFIFKNGNRRYKYLVLGHEEAYFVKEHYASKKVLWRWHHQDAWVSGRQHFRGFCGKAFPADSRHSYGNQLYPSSSRHISLLIWSRIYAVFALNRQKTVGISVHFHI